MDQLINKNGNAINKGGYKNAFCRFIPMGIYVNTYGTAHVKLGDGEIAKKVEGIFDMRPYFIEKRLKLRNPIYAETAAYGHMGREPKTVTKVFKLPNGADKTVEVELFTWEKLDYVAKVKEAFGL